MTKGLYMSYFNNRKQQNLEYKSRLQRSNEGCPWPAHIIAIVKLAYETSPRATRVLDNLKKNKKINDDELMRLVAAYEFKEWSGNNIDTLLSKLSGV